MLLIILSIAYGINEFLRRLVRARTVGYLFLGRNRPVNPPSCCACNIPWRMCDCETNCLNSLLHRLSRLSDNEQFSLNMQHASSYGMLPAHHTTHIPQSPPQPRPIPALNKAIVDITLRPPRSGAAHGVSVSVYATVSNPCCILLSLYCVPKSRPLRANMTSSIKRQYRNAAD